ncbi:MAG: CPBP family intramembrane metalloprotease [Flavobacteriales bacterium]|nr:CPBP family intramembrane metalloprotease [Flavobacteriales bacterium]
MDTPSAPEERSTDNTAYLRPPGLEFAMGVALFGVIVLVFFLVQSAVFIQGVIDGSPDLTQQGFSFSMLDDPALKERMAGFMLNGDLVAKAAAWSALIGACLILISVLLWKRGATQGFLGLRTPTWRAMLAWTAIFIILGVLIESLSYLFPVFRTDFMAQVVESTGNMFLLYVGVGILAPLFEELLLRGLLYGSLRHILDQHASVAISAGVFTMMHMQYSWAVMLLILPMGVVLGYARARSGSIWVPFVLHMLNNMASVAFPS